MKKFIALAAVAVASQAINAYAGPPETKQVAPLPPPVPTSFFRANELDLAAFATYGKGVGGVINRGIGEHAWGGGASVAYFPWLYAGFRVQGAAVSISRSDDTAGIVTGDLVLRYPLDLVAPNFHLAPYAFGGVGGLLGGDDGLNSRGNIRTTNKVLGNAGGGLEYRFTPHIGLFTEGGYNFVDGPKNNFVQVNFGLNYAF